jgi:hypothetical protein
VNIKSPANLVFVVTVVIAGVVSGQLGWKFMLDVAEGRTAMTWPDALALFIAVLLALQGAVLVGLSFARRSLGTILSGEERRTATARQVNQYRLQGAVLLLAALLLLLPVDATLNGLVPTQPRESVMVAIVACLALQSLLNLRLWFASDEFDRQLIANTSAVSFWATQIPIFLWGAAERMGMAPALTTWDLAVVIMAVYLMTSSFIAFRQRFG